MRKKIIASLLSGLTAVSPVLSYGASSVIIRVPVTTITFVTTATTYNFGNVFVGQAPQRKFVFTNTGTGPTTITGVVPSGKAVIIDSTCSGTLASTQSCTVTAALNVPALGPTQGVVSISHSAAATPNTYAMTATGVAADSALTAQEPLLDFGSTSVRMPTAPQTVHLKNTGNVSVDIMDVTPTDNAVSYVVDGSGCQLTLDPGQTCEVSVVFNPQYLGLLQSRLAVTLGDGTVANVSSMIGEAVQGTPAWSTSQLNFLDVPVGTPSAPQSVTLTNTGKGPLNITKLFISGDSSFQLVSQDCGSTLAGGASCTVTVQQTPLDTTIRTALLELDSTNSSLTVSRIQLYSRPVSSKAILTVSPLQLNFGDIALGQSSTQSLLLQSTGNLTVNVASYALSGAQAGSFSILNAADCTGALAPGNQCTLQVKATPTASGALQGSLAISADTLEPVPAVPLSANGVSGALSVAPGSLSFGSVTIGNSATLSATLTNSGTAPLTVASISGSAAAAAGFTYSGCVGQTLAAGGACTLTVTYMPTTAGAQTAGLVINNTGVPATATLNLSGTGVAPTPQLGSLSAGVCPSPAPTGSAFTCSSTLTNTGTIALDVPGPFSRTGTVFGAPSSNCPASLPVGGTCTVTLPATITTAGTYSTQLSAVTGAGTLSASVSAVVKDPQLTLTTTSHGIVTVGQTSNATHTLVNTGAFPVTLTLPPSVSTTTRPAGSTGARFSYVSTTCAASLAAGASCQFTTQFAPDVAGVFGGSLSVLAAAGTWSTTTTQSLAGTGANPPPTGAGLVATPNPVDFGNLKVGASGSQSFTLKNTNAQAATISSMALSGANASDFTVASNGCVTTLAQNATCSVTVNAKPGAVGARAAQVDITASVTGTVTPVGLQANGVIGVLTPSPTSLAFGSTYVGTPVTKTVTFVNSGSGSLTMGAAPTFTGTNASAFSLGSTTCANVTLVVGASCTMTVTYLAPLAATASATLHVSHDGQNGAVDVALSGTATPAPVGQPSLTAFTCSTPLQTGQSGTCTATLSNTGLAAFNFTGVSADSATLGTPTSNCPASLAVGGSCTVTLTTPVFATTGTKSATVTVATSAGSTSKLASLTVAAPSVALTTTGHGALQVGTSSTATQTFTNTGTASVTVTTPTISGSSVLTVSSNGCTSVAPGASCQIVTKCAPVSAGVFDGTLTVPVQGASASGTISCSGQAPTAAVVAAGSQSPDVGAYSLSGNWYRVRNTGIGPITVQGFFPSGTDWTLFSDSTNPGHCSVNKVLQAGDECLVMEILVTGDPNKVYTGTQRVRTSAGDLTWGSSMKTYGVQLQPYTPVTTVQTGGSATLEYRVVNQAPWPLGKVIPVLTGNGFSVSSTTCGTLSAAGQAGDTCSVFVTALGGTTAGTMSAALSLTGGYPQIINGFSNPSVRSGTLASTTLSLNVVAPKVTLTSGTFAPVTAGNSTQATHTVTNEGVGPVTLGAASLAKNVSHTYVSTTCGGSLAPGESCAVTTKYTALDCSATGVKDTLMVPYNGISGTLTLTGVCVKPTVVKLITAPLGYDTFFQRADGQWYEMGSPWQKRYMSMTPDAQGVYGPYLLSAHFNTFVMGRYHTLADVSGTAATIANTWAGGKQEPLRWWMLGNNTEGQLYAPTSTIFANWMTANTAPAQWVSTRGTMAAAGEAHSFIKDSDGNWWAAGRNSIGQLGALNGGNILALKGATRVVAGGDNSFAQFPDGHWVGTGANTSGQLGLGTTANSLTFTSIPALNGATEVVVGAAHVFAKLSDGTWAAAGSNSQGQLGLGDTTNRTTFTPVPALAGALKVVTAGWTTFAQMPSGAWVAAGYNGTGLMGLGDKSSRLSFTPIPALQGASFVATSGITTYAKLADGSWAGSGDGTSGLLGTNPSTVVFTRIAGLNDN